MGEMRNRPAPLSTAAQFRGVTAPLASNMSDASKNMRFRAWPITETAALEPMLREMGLLVPASEIDGTSASSDGQCLSDAMCSVGAAGRGGTGSFISSEGLVITNHHVALDAVRQ